MGRHSRGSHKLLLFCLAQPLPSASSSCSCHAERTWWWLPRACEHWTPLLLSSPALTTILLVQEMTWKTEESGVWGRRGPPNSGAGDGTHQPRPSRAPEKTPGAPSAPARRVARRGKRAPRTQKERASFIIQPEEKSRKK